MQTLVRLSSLIVVVSPLSTTKSAELEIGSLGPVLLFRWVEMGRTDYRTDARCVSAVLRVGGEKHWVAPFSALSWILT